MSHVQHLMPAMDVSRLFDLPFSQGTPKRPLTPMNSLVKNSVLTSEAVAVAI